MIPANEALDRLRAGNHRFASGTQRSNTNLSRSERAEMLEGQEPFAIVLGCSDSRVPAGKAHGEVARTTMTFQADEMHITLEDPTVYVEHVERARVDLSVPSSPGTQAMEIRDESLYELGHHARGMGQAAITAGEPVPLACRDCLVISNIGPPRRCRVRRQPAAHDRRSCGPGPKHRAAPWPPARTCCAWTRAARRARAS